MKVLQQYRIIWISLSISFAFPLLLLLVIPAAFSNPPLFGIQQDCGLLENDMINEASGLAASWKHPGILYTHNDSGSEPYVYCIDEHGGHRGRFHLNIEKARDWEDITVGPGPEDSISYIYVGDIGDNRGDQATIFVYRFPEPDFFGTEPSEIEIEEYDTIILRYPNSPRDAEALFVDPLTRDLYIISKRESEVGIYKAAYPQPCNTITTLEHVGSLPYTLVTAADISRDGTEILVKTYTAILFWRRDNGSSIAEVFQSTPEMLPYTYEPQGEAVAWQALGNGYFTLSEERNGVPSRLYFYQRN